MKDDPAIAIRVEIGEITARRFDKVSREIRGKDIEMYRSRKNKNVLFLFCHESDYEKTVAVLRKAAERRSVEIVKIEKKD